LQYSLESFAGLSVSVRKQFSIEIAAALHKKISAESVQGVAVARKRKHTSLASEADEEEVRKMLRITLELCGPGTGVH